MRRLFLRALFPVSNATRWTQRSQSNSPDATLTQGELQKLVNMLEDDPQLVIDVVGKLDAQSRRRLVVAGGAIEWFGKDSAVREVERADADKDRLISPKDFDHWLESAVKRRYGEDHARRADSTLAIASSNEGDVPFFTLVRIAFEAGLPFVGFGFLDNAVMILAGDMIDGTLGLYLNCSVMASAAMGNVVSGALGMQVHGFVDRAVQRLNFRAPVLTEAQMRGRRVFFAGHIGGTLGIMTGLLLGMLPLLLLESDDQKADRMLFQRWDRNGSGYLERPEIEQVFSTFGLSSANAETVLSKYGHDGRLSMKDFQKVREEIRCGKAVFA